MIHRRLVRLADYVAVRLFILTAVPGNQAAACSLADSLGREERIENAVADRVNRLNCSGGLALQR